MPWVPRETVLLADRPHGRVTFKVVNNGGIPYNLRIDGQQTPNIDPQVDATLKVTFTKSGNSFYPCTIPGHAEAGNPLR